MTMRLCHGSVCGPSVRCLMAKKKNRAPYTLHRTPTQRTYLTHSNTVVVEMLIVTNVYPSCKFAALMVMPPESKVPAAVAIGRQRPFAGHSGVTRQVVSKALGWLCGDEARGRLARV